MDDRDTPPLTLMQGAAFNMENFKRVQQQQG